MAHSNSYKTSSTKAHQSSNVSPLHHSGSTTMIRSSVEYQIDHRLYQLYENLRVCNPRILIMVNALNVVIRQYPALGPVITTCGDLGCFIAAITEYEEEAGL